MNIKNYKTIKVENNTKLKFDQLQLDLKKRGVTMNQNKLIDLTTSMTIDQIKLKCKTISDIRKLTEDYLK